LTGYADNRIMAERQIDAAPDISVVVVSWNTRDLLRACLASVPFGLSVRHEAEIWVVDNASSDGSAAMVAAEFPQVRLISNTENAGFARANNQAIRQSRGRHVLLLNSDTEVQPGALSEMTDYLDADPKIGAAGCRLLNADGTTQRSSWNAYPTLATLAADAFYLWRIPGLRRSMAGHVPFPNSPTQSVRVKHLLGACLIVRRPVLESVGLMDEGYFMYLEETDWCRRIDAAGWEIAYLPSPIVIHYGQQSAGLAPDKANADWCRSMCRFFRRQTKSGPLRIAALKAIIAATLLVRFGLHGARALIGRSRKPRPSLRGCLSALQALASA
jgi:hypothetical protein